MNGKTALVTGANSGLGKALAFALAQDGWRVGLVARNPERGAAAVAEIQAATGNTEVHLFIADFIDQTAIRQLAAAVCNQFEYLHLLINNAATAYPERQLSPDGIECAFAVNHLAPFLLTYLLLERLKASAPARIVTVGTRMNTALDFADLNWERRRYRMMQAYGQAKLGNLHFTFELARRLEGSSVTANCVFPGIFNSNLGGTDGAQDWFWKLIALLFGRILPTPEQAAQRVLSVATDPAFTGISGAYLGKHHSLKIPAQARNVLVNRQLWRISETLTGILPAAPSPLRQLRP
ncbi:SDR family NAD(P)-dependent oxidoreductase [Chromatium okenii]|uniref:SDR family NAD(P)-dependent oxidoreductase n=1 Tax=Chromatium okenii TaxID=61644 RepID=UPI0026EB5E5E|nr:SDR family NAD(P)-dependent oxidoreductase [Chromatium okenii]